MAQPEIKQQCGNCTNFEPDNRPLAPTKETGVQIVHRVDEEAYALGELLNAFDEITTHGPEGTRLCKGFEGTRAATYSACINPAHFIPLASINAVNK